MSKLIKKFLGIPQDTNMSEEELENSSSIQPEDEDFTKYQIQLQKLDDHECVDEEKKPMYTKYVYKMSADYFINLDLDPYKDQRAKDGDHINVLKEGMCSTQDTFHNFNVFHVEDKTISVVDGQHRYEALKRMSKTTRKNMSVWVFVYYFEEEDDDYSFRMFKQINTSKGINKDELDIQTKAHDLATAIKLRFGKHRNMDKVTDDKPEQDHQHWWKLSFLVLKNHIEKEWNYFKNLREADILSYLETYNNNALENSEEFFRKQGVRSNDCKTKCKNFRFFLGVNFPSCFESLK
jgi:hypothetical protein